MTPSSALSAAVILSISPIRSRVGNAYWPLVDLTSAELHSGNLPDACLYATKAADLLHKAAYANGVARLRAFRAAAQRPLPNGALRVLDKHLTQIAA